MKRTASRERTLKLLRKWLPYLQEKYGVQRVAIYGSFAKGKAGEKSDVDILVQLAKPLGLEFVTLAYEFERVLRRRVDLATFDTLQRSLENPRYRHIATDIEQTLVYA